MQLLKTRICDKIENTHPGDGLRVRLLYGGGHVPGEDAVEPQPPVLAEGHQLAVGGEGDGARLAAVQLGRVVAGHQHRGVLVTHCTAATTATTSLCFTWPLVYSIAVLKTFQVPSLDTVATLLESAEKEKL